VGVPFVNGGNRGPVRSTLSTAKVRNVNTHPSRFVTLTLCTPQAVHFSPLRRALEIIGENRTVWVPNSPMTGARRRFGEKCTLTAHPTQPLPLPSAVDVQMRCPGPSCAARESVPASSGASTSDARPV